MIDWLTSPLNSLRHLAPLDSIVSRHAPENREAFAELHRSMQPSAEPPMIPALHTNCATRNIAVAIDLQHETGLNRSETNGFEATP